MKFGKLYDKVAKLGVPQKPIMEEVMKNDWIDAQLIDLNQKQLLEQGIQADGSSTGVYSAKTIAIKREKGQITDHVTLKDTGDFYASMKVVVSDQGVTITGDMVKPDRDLEETWPKALGETDESKKEIMPEIRQRFVEQFRKAAQV